MNVRNEAQRCSYVTTYAAYKDLPTANICPMPEETHAQCPCYGRRQSLDCAANASVDIATTTTKTAATKTTITPTASRATCNDGKNVELTTRLQASIPSHKSAPAIAHTHLHTTLACSLHMRPSLQLPLPVAPPLHLSDDDDEDVTDDDEGHCSLQQQQHCYHPQQQQQQHNIDHSSNRSSSHSCHSSASDSDENDVGLQAVARANSSRLLTALTAAAPQSTVSAGIDTSTPLDDVTQASSFDDDCFVLRTPPAAQNE